MLIFVQYVAMEIVPDEPDDFLTQLKRMEFIVSKVIDKMPDEDVDVSPADRSDKDGDFGDTNEDHQAGGFCQCLPCCRSHGGKYLEKKIPTEGMQEVTVMRYPLHEITSTTENPLQH